MANRKQVLALFDANPNTTSTAIANKLGCCSAYVRATLSRNGRYLARSKHMSNKLQDWERQAIIDAIGEKQEALAHEFNVSIWAISKIWSRAGISKRRPSP